MPLEPQHLSPGQRVKHDGSKADVTATVQSDIGALKVLTDDKGVTNLVPEAELLENEKSEPVDREQESKSKSSKSSQSDDSGSKSSRSTRRRR